MTVSWYLSIHYIYLDPINYLDNEAYFISDLSYYFFIYMWNQIRIVWETGR